VSLTARTARNAVASTLGGLWSIALAVALAYVLIRVFGAELYGVYIIVTAAAGYIGLVELNLSSALVKYVAEHSGRAEIHAVEEVVGTTVFLYVVLSVMAAALFLFVGRAVLPLLHIPEPYLDMAWQALVISAASLPFTLLSNTLVMLPAAVGRFDTSVLASSAVATAATVATIVVALAGGRLVAVAITNAGAAVLGTAVAVAVARRRLPGVSFLPRWSRTRGRLLLSVSAFAVGGRLSSTLLVTLDRILVAVVLGPAAVAYYALPAGLMRRLGGLLSRTAYVLLPVTSALTGRLEHERLQRGYLRSARITWCLAITGAVLVFALSRPLLDLWIGPELAAQSVWVLRLLAIAFVFEAVSNVPAVMMEGAGFPKVTAAFALATTFVTLALLVPAMHAFGVAGAAAAAVVATAVTGPLFVHYAQRRLLGLTWRDTLPSVYVPRIGILRRDLRDVAHALGLARASSP
jgi:O-antigen/teichoic acid export membrane protein